MLAAQTNARPEIWQVRGEGRWAVGGQERAGGSKSELCLETDVWGPSRKEGSSLGNPALSWAPLPADCGFSAGEQLTDGGTGLEAGGGAVWGSGKRRQESRGPLVTAPVLVIFFMQNIIFPGLSTLLKKGDLIYIQTKTLYTILVKYSALINA
jgi:hypothetical protein